MQAREGTVTFEQILDSKGIHHEQGSPGWINIPCCFCEIRGKDVGSRPLLGVHVVQDCAYCLHCQWSAKKGGVQKVLDALRIDEMVSGREKPVDVEEAEAKLPDEYVRLVPIPKGELLREAYDYLRHRGLSDKQITKKRVGVCLSGRYAYRVILPVISVGTLCGFVARDFTGRQKVPYLNSDGNLRRRAVYNLRGKRHNIALLFEGIIKCLVAERVLGEDVDCLSVLGKSVTDEQVELLHGYKRIVVVPDNDGPGLQGSIKMAAKLVGDGFDVALSRIDRKWKDADEAYVHGDSLTLRNLVVNAQQYSETLVSRIRMEAAWDYRGR
jgi:hypothetical protein